LLTTAFIIPGMSLHKAYMSPLVAGRIPGEKGREGCVIDYQFDE